MLRSTTQPESDGFPAMTFFSEIQRRKVFRVGAAYLVVAWVLAQVTDLAVPALHLPGWVTTLVLFLLLVGFPVALILAWAYEITPDGIKRAKDIPAKKNVERTGARKLDFAVIALLTVAVAVLVVDKYLLDGQPVAGEAEVAGASRTDALGPRLPIAVLPFANMSGDAGQEHFADGLSEELLNSLAAIDGLRVISRTSSFAFKGKDTSIGEIAASLGVGHILEGSVRRAGSRIRVTAQLIDTSTDSHLWSRSFDRELSLENILEIQEEIASTVIDALQLELLPGASQSPPGSPNNLSALDLYHDGMYFLRQIEIGGSDLGLPYAGAVDRFEAAIRADPDWAPPRAALGRVYHFWKDVGNTAEKLRISKTHVMDAIRLDETYAPAYNSLGYILTAEGDYGAAMDAYDRAAFYGRDEPWGRAILLAALGRSDEAVREYRKAIAHDPLSFGPRIQLVLTYRCIGSYDEVIAAIEGDDTVLAAAPSINTQILLAEAYARIGNVESALRVAEDGARRAGSDMPFAFVFALAGDEVRAKAALEPVAIIEDQEFLIAAHVSALLGEKNRALNYLEQAIERTLSRFRMLDTQLFLQCTPEFRELKGDPRYDALVARLSPSA